jgi:hypothetical protein
MTLNPDQYSVNQRLADPGTTDRPHLVNALPFFLFRSGGTTCLRNGRGTVVLGLAPQDKKVSVGDVIEVRRGTTPVFRRIVREVSQAMGSPPPPAGTARLGLIVDSDEDVGDIQEDLEVWIVATRD